MLKVPPPHLINIKMSVHIFFFHIEEQLISYFEEAFWLCIRVVFETRSFGLHLVYRTFPSRCVQYTTPDVENVLKHEEN